MAVTQDSVCCTHSVFVHNLQLIFATVHDSWMRLGMAAMAPFVHFIFFHFAHVVLITTNE